jgi:bifunctional DNase/RNase
VLKKKTIRFVAAAGLCFAASILPPAQTTAQGFTPVALEQKELLQVTVHQLSLDPISNQPVVVLADSREERALVIWIDFFSANAIHLEIQGLKHRRPLTHDLLERIIQQTNAKIHRVVITHFKKEIYYARIEMEREGSRVKIDARPSDAIIMALKFKAPIFVSKALFNHMAIPLEEHKEVEDQYGLSLQELTPSLAQAFSFGSTRGALVADVREGSSAEDDGIERGDIFVEVGGQSVEDVRFMKDVLARSKTAVEARIFRKARFLSITLHPK